MKPKSPLTKILAIAGTLLAWFPIVASLLIAVAVSISRRQLRFDFLMPAELYPVAVMGGGLLVWAVVRAHTRRRLIGWGFAITTGSLLILQALDMAGWPGMSDAAQGRLWGAISVILLVAYSLALLTIDVGGVLLLRDLFRAPRRSAPPARA